MGFENARDSFNDLREMSKRSVAESKKKKISSSNNIQNSDGDKSTSRLLLQKKPAVNKNVSRSGSGLHGAVDSLNDLRRINYRRGPPSPGFSYGCQSNDQGDEESEENWPIYELTASDRSAAGVYTGVSSNGGTVALPSMISCERICTVPEVFDELKDTWSLQKLSSLVLRDVPPPPLEEPCQNLLRCFTPWNDQRNQTFDYNDAFINSQSLSQIVDPIGRTSVAVDLYSSMPQSFRQSFAPSMFKVRFTEGVGSNHDSYDEKKSEQTASLVGYDHRYVYSLGRDRIKKSGNTPPSSPSIEKRNYKVHFSEIKRVLKVRKFTPDEALDVWFQRDDFDHFKAEMTLLIQEDEASQELAEVWLKAKTSRVASDSSDSDSCNETVTTPSDEHNSTAPAGSKKHKSYRSRASINGRARAWWHNYDHSRRGLERYASPGQARQIFSSYKVAVQKVLGEQRRQRLLGFFCFPNAYDPEKIAEVYHEYTAWSRDLALAAGASDADAVSTNFDDDKRHTREYYVLKQVIASGYKVHKHMPQFMLPRCITPTGYLNEAETLHHDDYNILTKAAKNTTPGKRRSVQSRQDSPTAQEIRDFVNRVNKLDFAS